MIESLISIKDAIKTPWKMIFVAFIIGVVAAGTANLVTAGVGSGHLVVAFCCIAGAPIFTRMIKREAAIGSRKSKDGFLTRHHDLLEMLACYFIGIVLAVSMLYAFTPQDMGNSLFGTQKAELEKIQTMSTGRVVSGCNFMCLLENNMGVLVLSLIFSVVFGAGAIYIITWNASIVGVLIGGIAKSQASYWGNIVISYIVALPSSIVVLFPHGLFEIGAYFMGGLSGGILSVAIMRGQWYNRETMIDVVGTFMIGIALIVIGALIEAV